MNNCNFPLRFVTHSKLVQSIAYKNGWLPAARYTNMRDVGSFQKVYFIDIDFKNYSFDKHLSIVMKYRPHITVARDVFDINQLEEILYEAKELNLYSDLVVIVPKDIKLSGKLNDFIPENYLLGYSVPSKYGGTKIPPEQFTRPTHLLGGRPDIQHKLGKTINTYSFDCNRFTIDAAYGKYFTSSGFKRHPKGGYINCITDSIININSLWSINSHEQ